MKLVLAEYISSLKEDGELDLLLQELLRAHEIEVFSRPERGRQYGVDIYAVGKDFEDNNKKKIFLITVKQGDLDRNMWQGGQNSLQPSLDEIRDVFIRNNIAPQHKKLPIKIIVATNGLMKQAIQQNWAGYTSNNPYEYTFWGIDFLTDKFQNKLLNEHAFSEEVRSLIRKTIIYLENPEYDLNDFTKLLDQFMSSFRTSTSKRAKLKELKQIRLVTSIIAKYCEENNNLKHAVRCSEKYLLVLWNELSQYDKDKEYIQETIAAYQLHHSILNKYVSKLSGVYLVKDGFSKYCHESLTYTFVVYEQIGIVALSGLEFLQLSEILSDASNTNENIISGFYRDQAMEMSNLVVSIINNNTIIFNPRSDDQLIEINLILILLYKLNREEDIKVILSVFSHQIAEGIKFSNIFPVFTNDKRKIAELDANHKTRLSYKYGSSNLLASLIEWTAVIDNANLYVMYRHLKQQLLPDLDLMLWFPDGETESKLYKEYATSDTGYALSGIELPEDFNEFKEIIKTEHIHNCHEKEISFIKSSLWTIGLIASRHFRTYTFPYYWRQFMPELSEQ